MPAPVPEELVAEWFAARLARITRANGFSTDAGLRVFAHEPPPERNPAAPLIWYADTGISWEAQPPRAQSLGTCTLTVEVTALVIAGPGERTDARAAVRDIVRAIAQRDALPTAPRGIVTVRPISSDTPPRGEGNYLPATVTFAALLGESQLETQSI